MIRGIIVWFDHNNVILLWKHFICILSKCQIIQLKFYFVYFAENLPLSDSHKIMKCLKRNKCECQNTSNRSTRSHYQKLSFYIIASTFSKIKTIWLKQPVIFSKNTPTFFKKQIWLSQKRPHFILPAVSNYFFFLIQKLLN